MEATFGDRALVLDETLVCADLHIGKGRTANVDLPLGERENLVDRLDTLLAAHGVERVVFAGDVLHSFDRVPADAEGTLTALIQTVRDAGAELVVIRGNHDTMLETLWSGAVHDEYVLEAVPGVGPDGAGTVVVCHGHREPTTEADWYVVGHDHPTITIEGQKWHCYLYGPGVYRGADVLVLPAFSHLVEGVPVEGRYGPPSFMSPLISDPDRFRPVVRDETADETRTFPALGEFRHLL